MALYHRFYACSLARKGLVLYHFPTTAWLQGAGWSVAPQNFSRCVAASGVYQRELLETVAVVPSRFLTVPTSKAALGLSLVFMMISMLASELRAGQSAGRAIRHRHPKIRITPAVEAPKSSTAFLGYLFRQPVLKQVHKSFGIRCFACLCLVGRHISHP